MQLSTFDAGSRQDVNKSAGRVASAACNVRASNTSIMATSKILVTYESSSNPYHMLGRFVKSHFFLTRHIGLDRSQGRFVKAAEKDDFEETIDKLCKECYYNRTSSIKSLFAVRGISSMLMGMKFDSIVSWADSRKTIAIFALLTALCLANSTKSLAADATGTAPALLAEASPLKNGVFTIDGLQFMVLHKSDRWAPALQRDLAVSTGYPMSSADTFDLKGSFKTDSCIYDFAQTMKAVDATSISYTASISGQPTKGSKILCLTVALPVSVYRGQQIYFDEQGSELPWWDHGPVSARCG